ncbi:unnamed protein product, partial [Ceratitis capitata]
MSPLKLLRRPIFTKDSKRIVYLVLKCIVISFLQFEYDVLPHPRYSNSARSDGSTFISNQDVKNHLEL